MPAMTARDAITRISPAITLDCSDETAYTARVFGCGCQVSADVMRLLARLLDGCHARLSLMPAGCEAVVDAGFEEVLGGDCSVSVSCAMGTRDGVACRDVRGVSVILSATRHAIRMSAMMGNGDAGDGSGHVALPPICRNALRALAEERVCDAKEMLLMAVSDLLDEAVRDSPRTHRVQRGNVTVLWTHVGAKAVAE